MGMWEWGGLGGGGMCETRGYVCGQKGNQQWAYREVCEGMCECVCVCGVCVRHKGMCVGRRTTRNWPIERCVGACGSLEAWWGWGMCETRGYVCG